MEEGSSILLIIILLILTAFFVISEFAIVKIRKTKIEELILEGNKTAVYVKKITENLDGYLSACQLGITITALGLGWLGEPTVQKIITPLFVSIELSDTWTRTLSFAAAFLVITFLHVVLGELAPKNIAIQKAEKVSLMIAKPLMFFYKLMYPMIWFLNGSAILIVKALGVEPSTDEETHSEEEIKIMLTNNPNLDPDEQKMLHRIFHFDDRFIREIMVHRKDMDCIFLTDSNAENIEKIKKSKHSRIIVCGKDKDDVEGYITLKDLYNQQDDVDFEKIIRNIPRIYETTSVKKALKVMQSNKHQIAVVVDEYGGVSGLITIEDAIEEIVGDIQDEFDDEMLSFRRSKEGVVVAGTVLIDQVSDEFAIQLEEIDGVDTIGGYVLSKIEQPPKPGKYIEFESYRIEIKEVEDLRIKNLLFKKIASEQ